MIPKAQRMSMWFGPFPVHGMSGIILNDLPVSFQVVCPHDDVHHTQGNWSGPQWRYSKIYFDTLDLQQSLALE